MFIRYLYIQLGTKWANRLCSEHMDTEYDILTDGLLKLQTCFVFSLLTVFIFRRRYPTDKCWECR